jgi:hypothetical protein
MESPGLRADALKGVLGELAVLDAAALRAMGAGGWREAYEICESLLRLHALFAAEYRWMLAAAPAPLAG